MPSTADAMSVLWNKKTYYQLQKSKDMLEGSDSSESEKITSLLDRFSCLQCADDRDRIYALAGLAADATLIHPGNIPRRPREAIKHDHLLQIYVDYTKPTAVIYGRLALDYMLSESFPGSSNQKIDLIHCAAKRADGVALQPTNILDAELEASDNKTHLLQFQMNEFECILDRETKGCSNRSSKGLPRSS
ncbi:hypothetical protein B0J14DRAFT_563122 [Halenospora varia]|nr:hypothetical protein B0J14DRAFT_563122 [Halenospora varia]